MINRPLRFAAGKGENNTRLLSGVFHIKGHAVSMLLKELPPLPKLSESRNIVGIDLKRQLNAP